MSSLQMTLVGAGEFTSFEDISRRPYLRFRSAAGTLHDLPVTTEQLETVMAFAVADPRPQPQRGVASAVEEEEVDEEPAEDYAQTPQIFSSDEDNL